MTLAEIELRATYPLSTGYHHDHETLIRWVRALLTCAHHAPTCHSLFEDGLGAYGPCTCGLDALLEEIGA